MTQQKGFLALHQKTMISELTASVPATCKMNWKLFFIICCLRKLVYTSEVTESLIGKSAYDDEHLIRTIKNTLLIPPNTEKPYNFTDDKNNDKSQFVQDEIVAKLFNYKRNGFFIEAGAYDGKVYSNTLQLELRYNWTGILVEPNPDNFVKLLTKNRKSYAIETCLSISDKVEEVSFDAAGKQC